MKTKRGRGKFEEDLKPTFTCDYPFHTLFSYSTTRALSKKLTLGKLKHLFHLFPDLKRQLKAHERSEPLTAVGGFTAYEQVILGPSLQIRKSPRASAECALILWHTEDEQTLLTVEVSFRYKDEKARFSQKMVRRANEVYSSLQESKLLAKWVDPGSSTKTAYVYSLVDY